MKRARVLAITAVAVCILAAAQTAPADTLIYSNSIYQGYYPFGDVYEVFDYGISPGGRVSKFTFGYRSTSVTPIVRVRFYQNIGISYLDPGFLTKQITLTNLPSTGGTIQYYEYVIPEEDRFDLPNGYFGYSFDYYGSPMQSVIASGGAGNADELWVFAYDDWWGYDWFLFGFSNAHAGLYMKIYTGPPINEITCNIEGYIFHDLNGNGLWNDGEPALPGWEAYLDQNQNGSYQPAEPNAVADPNGLYRFEYLPAPETYTLRLILPDGWSQTTPGAAQNHQYIINADPNTTYGPYNFGVMQGLPVKYGGGDGTTQTPYQIWNAQHMNQIGLNQEDWDKHFILMDNIDMSGITGEQYNIIGYRNSAEDYLYFTGVFNGNNHTISNFSYTTTSAQNHVGLFGYTEGAEISHLNMVNATISSSGQAIGSIIGYHRLGLLSHCTASVSIYGKHIVGGLVGGSSGTITHSASSGSVSGADQGLMIGGLAGFFNEANVSNCYSSADVSGGQECKDLGGLAGNQYRGSVADCYSTGTVIAGQASQNAGGLIGEIWSGGISRCWSSANITAGTQTQFVGGLAGSAVFGYIDLSFSTGPVFAESGKYIGGLNGSIYSSSISRSYSTGSVTVGMEGEYLGGLVGISYGGDIYCCYSTGVISNSSFVMYAGGLIGWGFGANNSFWDVETSGLQFSGGGKGRSTAQMMQASNYINWNTPSETYWVLDEGNDYPRLAWEGTAGSALPLHTIYDFLDGEGTESEPFRIYTAEELNIIGLFIDDYDKAYSLQDNIDLSELQTNEYNQIGSQQRPFSGVFYGNGFSISNFTHITEGYENGIGLFGSISGTVEALTIENMDISTLGGFIGGLAASLTDSGQLLGCYVSGNIVFGHQDASEIGGLIGSSSGAIINCGANVNISGGYNAQQIGGLVGAHSQGNINDSYSIGVINAGDDAYRVGGLAGYTGGSLSRSYSLGSITTGSNSSYVGGLAGQFSSELIIANCYSRASVTSGSQSNYIGGLTGYTASTGISYCYSTGAVTAGSPSTNVGGLVGRAQYSYAAYQCFWDIEASGQPTSFTGTGRTTAQMRSILTYGNWDFIDTWRICDGTNYPRLRWEPLLPGDFVCPEGVGPEDLLVLADEWLMEVIDLPADIAPPGGDGVVDLHDWLRFAQAWLTWPGHPDWDPACNFDDADDIIDIGDLQLFADQWLARTAQAADIAPAGGDGVVNFLDFAVLAENWLVGID